RHRSACARRGQQPRQRPARAPPRPPGHGPPPGWPGAGDDAGAGRRVDLQRAAQRGRPDQISRLMRSMMQRKALAWLAAALISAVLSASTGLVAQPPAAGKKADWPLHNLDLAGSRFSLLDQINPSNVATLTPRFLFQYGVIDGVSNQTTPVVVDGVMYVTDPRGSVYAVDASEGQLLWTYDVSELIGGGRKEGYIFRKRGVCFADGVIYTAAGSFLFALDAKT